MSGNTITGEKAPRTGDGVVRIFKRLRAGKVETVEHGLCTLPLVDVYRLDYFPVVSAADDQTLATWVNFYLYQTSDRSVHRPGAGDERLSLYARGRPEARLPLHRVLAELGIEPGGDTHLGDVVTELWKALFAPPSDPFDETAFASSPWLDRCCGDRRTVDELKQRGDWNDLWLRFSPRKGPGLPVETVQVDYDTLTLRLLPPYEGLYAANEATSDPGVPDDAPILHDELNLMLLLRA